MCPGNWNTSSAWVAARPVFCYLDRMTLETIRRAYSAQPFRPFILHVADGRNLEVPHPEFMATAPNGRVIALFDRNGDYHFVDLLLVTSLEIKEAAPPGGSAME